VKGVALETVVERPAALDVHKEQVNVEVDEVRDGGSMQQVCPDGAARVAGCLERGC
jgi:hypothetical protein